MRRVAILVLLFTAACLGSSYSKEISKAEELISKSTKMWGDIISCGDYNEIIKTCNSKAKVDEEAIEHLKKAIQLGKDDRDKEYAEYLLNYVENSMKATNKYREYAELMLNGKEKEARIAAEEATGYIEEAIDWKKRASQLRR